MESVFSKLRPFSEDDWACYAGCESEDPMIYDTDDYVVVVDGLTVTLVLDDYCIEVFRGSQLSLTCKTPGELVRLLLWSPKELFDNAQKFGFRGM